MSRTVETHQRYLRKIGWDISVDGKMGPRTREAIREFQRGWAYTKLPLKVSGKLTRRTKKWIRWSANHNGRCSKNFRYSEFASRGNGWIRTERRLVRGLEKYRLRVGHGVGIVSGYRDPDHNAAVGGAIHSRHKDGDATDLYPELTLHQVKELQVFTGIGYQGSGPLKGKVRHVDTRPGSVKSPTVWTY